MLIIGAASILLLLPLLVILALKYGAFTPSSFQSVSTESARVHSLQAIKKIPQADINKYRTMFFFTGLFISLCFSYYIITFTEVERHIVVEDNDVVLAAEDELIVITEQLPPPPPPPPPMVKTPVIVESEEPVIEEPEIDLEIEEEPEIIEPDYTDFEDPAPEPAVVDNTVYNLAELHEQPRFPDGLFQNYISSHFEYPERLIEEGEEIRGRIFISFIIEKDGKVSNVEVMKGRGLHPLLDKEAIRVIQSAPNWSPGKNAGLPVRVKYVIPVKF